MEAHTDHPHTWWSPAGQWEGQQLPHGLRECALMRVTWSAMPRVSPVSQPTTEARLTAGLNGQEDTSVNAAGCPHVQRELSLSRGYCWDSGSIKTMAACTSRSDW